jgi:hypothetical protein
MKSNPRHVAETVVGGKHVVSTVQLSVDHSWGEGPPLWFETMVFRCSPEGKVTDFEDLDCERYSTREQALEGHEVTVKKWEAK